MITLTATGMEVFDLKSWQYSNKKTAYTFSASSLNPNKHGIHAKYYMRVEPDMVSQLERLKIKNGSIVDIVAKESNYKDKDGKYCNGWEVKDISISDVRPSARNKAMDQESNNTAPDEISTQEETLATIVMNFSNNLFGDW